MEYTFDFDIIGEIMIPLKNNFGDFQESESNPNKRNFNNKLKFNPLASKLESLLDGKNYKDFRSTLFQGELLRFFVFLKIEKTKDLDISKLINNFYIKFEFDSSCDGNEYELKKFENTPKKSLREILLNPNKSFLSINDNESSQIQCDAEGNDITDLFSLQRNTLYNNFSNRNTNNSNSYHDYKNKNYDFISRRHFIEDKNIAILEVLRHIVVPNKFLNKNLIMKLDIMFKNENEYVNNFSIDEIFNSGIYHDLKEFTIIKTLFKEVKIIRPLLISKTKQIDVMPDTSYLQVKIENKTSSINFIDKNLKNSKFLTYFCEKSINKIVNIEDNYINSDVLNYGISLQIKDIQVLNEETKIDKKTTINLKNLDQYNNKKDATLIPITNSHFTLLNKQFPIDIKPGEEITIILKLQKTAYISEKILGNEEIDNYDVSNQNTYMCNSNRTNSNPFTINRKSSNHSGNSLINNNLTKYNSYNPFNDNVSVHTNNNNINLQNSLITNSGNAHNTIINCNINNINSNITNKIKVYENASVLHQDTKTHRRKNSFTSMNTVVTNSNNVVMHNYNFGNFADQVHEIKSPNSILENNEVLEESNFFLDDEIIKVILNTPIILDIASDKFYDNLFMTIPIKWHNEITRFLKIEIEFPDNINLHEYFTAYLKASNISNYQMDLTLEISEANCELVNNVRLETDALDYKEKGYIFI